MTSHFSFFNDTATTEIYTLSLHDALPICHSAVPSLSKKTLNSRDGSIRSRGVAHATWAKRLISGSEISRLRSEEHTSELQSQSNLVCRLLLEKKNKHKHTNHLPLTDILDQ